MKEHDRMDVQAILSQARDAITVKRVFGEPIERNGVTVIPVANIAGGGGGGSGGGSSEDGSGSGGGVGYGMKATPAGVYVIEGDEVSWEPALDLNRVILGGQIVAIVLFLVIRSILRHRAE
ncbi:MAG TPA: spore germination protein GerW family protein [Thermomicrobiales bacterium]|nr:spore germination protein GerW family protein [Thermomicrobiales bacterium]